MACSGPGPDQKSYKVELRLEGAPEADIDTGLGNAISFMIVVMGRMQLFTERNVTTVLPVIRDSN